MAIQKREGETGLQELCQLGKEQRKVSKEAKSLNREVCDKRLWISFSHRSD